MTSPAPPTSHTKHPHPTHTAPYTSTSAWLHGTTSPSTPTSFHLSHLTPTQTASPPSAPHCWPPSAPLPARHACRQCAMTYSPCAPPRSNAGRRLQHPPCTPFTPPKADSRARTIIIHDTLLIALQSSSSLTALRLPEGKASRFLGQAAGTILDGRMCLPHWLRRRAPRQAQPTYVLRRDKRGLRGRHRGGVHGHGHRPSRVVPGTPRPLAGPSAPSAQFLKRRCRTAGWSSMLEGRTSASRNGPRT